MRRRAGDDECIAERADNGRQSNIRKLPVSGSPGEQMLGCRRVVGVFRAVRVNLNGCSPARLGLKRVVNLFEGEVHVSQALPTTRHRRACSGDPRFGRKPDRGFAVTPVDNRDKRGHGVLG